MQQIDSPTTESTRCRAASELKREIVETLNSSPNEEFTWRDALVEVCSDKGLAVVKIPSKGIHLSTISMLAEALNNDDIRIKVEDPGLTGLDAMCPGDATLTISGLSLPGAPEHRE